MIAKEVVIRSKHGLHARPAAKISEYVNSVYPTEVKVVDPRTSTEADARSILTMLTLGLVTGSPIRVEANGPQESEAAEEVARIIEEFDV